MSTTSIHPRFEFYEYDIEGYGYESSSFFTNFRQRRPTNEHSKRIKVNETRSTKEKTVYQHLESSIDPIVSMDTQEGVRNIEENAIKKKLNLSQYLKAYRTWATRVPLKNINKNFYSNSRKILMTDSIKMAIQYKNIQFLIDNLYRGITFEQFLEINPNSLNNGGFVFKIDVPENEKIISFGDFHGSFHTFLRNIFRLHLLGVLDLSNGQYKINDGYRLLFLGDIVDRGNYALDIIYILSQFINNNDIHKIMIIRGNHEDERQYFRNGFMKEFQKKLNKPDDMKILFKYFFSTLPTTIILQHGQTRYWTCHGGIPYTERQIIKFDDLFENQSKVIFFSGENSYIADQIRWNDFSNKPNTVISDRGDDFYLIGTDYLKRFLKENNLNMILRGHNDRYFNSFLFCRYPRSLPKYKNQEVNTFSDLYPEIYPLSKVPIQPNTIVPQNLEYFVEKNPVINHFLHKTPKSSFQNFNLSNGPVAILDIQQFYQKRRILGNKFNKNIEGFTFFPIVTISTNTDNGRPLTRDSFMVIRNVDNVANYGLFTYQFMSQMVLNNPNNILSKISPFTQQIAISKHPSSNQEQKTISCRRFTDDSLSQFTDNDNHKEKNAIRFYLKKGICKGIMEGSRKIIKTNQFIQFYKSSSESVTIPLQDFILLYQSTPFISFTILDKMITENIHQNCSELTHENTIKLCKIINLFNLLIDNIPNISSYYKIKHPITLLVNKIKSIFSKHFSVDIIRKLKLKSIPLNKRELFIQEMLNNMKVLFSFYNFICYKTYHDESPSFMREIKFLPDSQQPSVIDLYMNHLPHFDSQKRLIVNSLLGINNQYIQESLVVEKIINQRNIISYRNENLQRLRVNNASSNSALATINYQILERFVQRLIKTPEKVSIMIQFIMKDCTNDSIELSNLEKIYLENTNNKSKYNQIQVYKQDLSEDIVSLITGYMNTSGIQITGILNDFLKNTTNYSNIRTISKGSYGEVFNMPNQGKIKKKEPLFNINPYTNQRNTFNPLTIMKVLKENLINYYLHEFSLLQQNQLLQCFPRIFLNTSITTNNTNITTEIQKINGENLTQILIKALKSSLYNPHIFDYLIQLSDIVKYYQDNYGFIHGDLHGENILIENETNKIYIIDFGRSSIQIPIQYHQNNHLEKKTFYLIDNMSFDGITTNQNFDQDIQLNEINHSKAIDFMYITLFLLKNFGKLRPVQILHQKLSEKIPSIMQNIRLIFGMHFGFIAFYSNRIQFLQNQKSLPGILDIQNEFENNLHIFYPENFKQIIQECMV